MKTYVIAPLVALLLFSGYYWQATGALRRAAEAAEAQRAAEHTARLQAEREAQKQALTAALAEQERRKKERAEKEAAELATQEARQAALTKLDAARRRQNELTRQLDRLRADLAIENKSVAELEAAQKTHLSEQAFLRDFTAQADANVKSLATVLEKLLAAQAAARAAAAKAPTP
jgi:chromosome segregation ATPase